MSSLTKGCWKIRWRMNLTLIGILPKTLDPSSCEPTGETQGIILRWRSYRESFWEWGLHCSGPLGGSRGVGPTTQRCGHTRSSSPRPSVLLSCMEDEQHWMLGGPKGSVVSLYSGWKEDPGLHIQRPEDDKGDILWKLQSLLCSRVHEGAGKWTAGCPLLRLVSPRETVHGCANAWVCSEVL